MGRTIFVFAIVLLTCFFVIFVTLRFCNGDFRKLILFHMYFIVIIFMEWSIPTVNIDNTRLQSVTYVFKQYNNKSDLFCLLYNRRINIRLIPLYAQTIMNNSFTESNLENRNTFFFSLSFNYNSCRQTTCRNNINVDLASTRVVNIYIF